MCAPIRLAIPPNTKSFGKASTRYFSFSTPFCKDNTNGKFVVWPCLNQRLNCSANASVCMAFKHTIITSTWFADVCSNHSSKPNASTTCLKLSSACLTVKPFSCIPCKCLPRAIRETSLPAFNKRAA